MVYTAINTDTVQQASRHTVRELAGTHSHRQRKRDRVTDRERGRE